MATDIIFINQLNLSATVGLDWWGRSRPQPISISLYLHLTPNGFLSRVGQSDNVADTIDYSQITKTVTSYVENGQGFQSVNELIDGVVERAFEKAGENAGSVRVVVKLPKMVQLAQGGVVVETVVSRGGDDKMNVGEDVRRKVYLRDLSFAVVIGVNDAERLEKQRVVVNLEVDEVGVVARENANTVDYAGLVRELAKDAEHMAYLTLEKFVWELVRRACFKLEDRADQVSVRGEKPSALSFAQSAGVEMTRRRADFI